MRDAELIAALAKLVEERPSRGFGKCCQRLEKSHPHWNDKRIYRVYCAMKLNLRRAASRRLPKRECVPLYVPEHPDTVWSARNLPRQADISKVERLADWLRYSMGVMPLSASCSRCSL